jgi:UDP-glucose 4-epimerase
LVKRRLLITGSSGFIGKSLRGAIEDNKFEVIGLDRTATYPGDLRIDLRDDQVNHLIESFKPEIIVHLAAQIDVSSSFEDPVEDFLVNSLGTLKLIRSGIHSNCKNFVYIASGGAVYGAPDKLPSLETDKDFPMSPYGISKNVGEQYLRVLTGGTDMQWTSLALSNCYGGFELHKRGVIYEFWKALSMEHSPTIYGPENSRDFINIEDVESAILLAINKPLNQRVNISSNTEISLLQLFNKMKNLMGVEIEPLLFPAKNGDVKRSRLDNSNALKLLGWKPKISIEKGLAKILENERNYG